MTYEQAKNKSYHEYKKIDKIYCPYLKTEVVFNSKGFWHIIYTARNKKRDKKTQQFRFQLLNKAVKVLKVTTTLQEYEQDVAKRIHYYGFIAIIDSWKLKVIVKKRGTGQPYFWSIIPNWHTRRRADKKIRILSKGSMEKD